jgi:hypothetical protein
MQKCHGKYGNGEVVAQAELQWLKLQTESGAAVLNLKNLGFNSAGNLK